MYSFFTFFRGFLQHPFLTSSVVPTSRSALRQILQSLPRRSGQIIVEYGPGTGGLARAVLKSGKMDAGSQLLLIENNPAFARYLQRTFSDPRVFVHCASAAEVRRILHQHHAEHAHAIFCSIPLSVMEESERTHILRETHEALAEDGVFIAYFARRVVEEYVRRFFSVLHVERLRCNMPPLILCIARKKS